MEKPILYYVYDPMCSWCWGYRPAWQALKEQLEPVVDIQYRVGGLAPDSDLPMPADMQTFLQGVWHKINAQLGTQFNHDFWTHCQPRRSTYPACRAVLI
ncbi:MAG: DsbA family protein, partial [Psychrosphaera sp.]|nr:DsbA family protein [Psychrosphaera sp.]